MTGDFNDDGLTDIVFAHRVQITQPGYQKLNLSF